MAYEDAATFVASGARVASGNSAAFPTGKGLNLNVLVNVTARSGTTPTLDLSVEWSMDGTNFAPGQPADTFTQITATGSAVKSFAIKAPFFRLVWAIGGTTPSFTFDATRYAVGQ